MGSYDFGESAASASGTKGRRSYDFSGETSASTSKKAKRSSFPSLGVAATAIYDKSPVLQATVGLGRGVVDLMSRGMYASAGAAEEVSRGGGIPAVADRVAREVFSGLPFTGIQGDKRDFIEVMERAGVPELGHLHDIVPFNAPMFGGVVGPGKFDPTGRGAIGFAANIALDPTTYITAGGSNVGKFATAEHGIINLNKRGLVLKDMLVDELAPTYKLLAESSDNVLAEEGRRQVRAVLETKVVQAVRQDPSLLEKTGLKFAGMEVISPRLAKKFTAPVRTMLESAPWGARAAKVSDGFESGIRRGFDAFADIAKLDEPARVGVMNKMREYRNAIAANLHRDAQVWDPLRRDAHRLAKNYGSGGKGRQVLGKKFADWRQGTAAVKLTPGEEDLFARLADNIEKRSEQNVRNGVISGEQFDKYKGKYLHQNYKNKEVLSETMGQMYDQAVENGLITPSRVNKERQFESFAEAVDISKRLNTLGKQNRLAGGVRAIHGELIPEYDIAKNLWSHMEQSNRAIFQKKLFDDIAENYGLKLDEFFDPSRVYAINEPIHVGEADSKIIDDFLDKKTLKPMSEERQAELAAKAKETGKYVDDNAGWDALVKDIRETLPKLSDDGQRELSRQLTSMARDESHVLKVMDAVGEDLFPKVNAMREGDINPFFLKHGLPEEKARLVKRGGGLWGDEERLIPKAIADLLDDADRDLLKSKDWQKNFGWVVKGFDKIGNAFKGVTYPAYISGAFRDLYNNLQHTYLALGVGGLTRPDLAARVRAGGEGLIEIGKMTRTAEQWKALSESLRVVDPSASSFVQTSGKQGAEKATLYAKARALRGQVDNGTRTQLWTAGMRMGMTPEDAARMVHEFHYNYAELTKVERDIIKRFIPFAVFPLKTIKLYPKLIATQPMRLSTLNKMFMGRDSENKEMTTWEGEGFKIRLDRNGRDVTVLNGVDLPIRSFDMLWSGSFQKTLERLVGSSHPLPKVAYMWASGRDPFRGREMTRMSSQAMGRMLESAPAPIREFVGLRTKKDAAGRTTYTMNEEKVRIAMEISMLSRVFSTSDRYFRDQMNEPGAPNFWLSFFTGLQYKTLNLDEEKKKKLAEAQRAAEEEAVKQGDAYRFQKILPTKGAAQ